MEDKQLTLQEVASRMRVSDDTIYRLLKKGVLAGYKVGLQWRIKQSELDRFMFAMSNNRQQATASANW